MPSLTLTFVLCLLTASSRILLKRGMESSNALTGMVVSLLIGWLFLAPAALVSSSWADVNLHGVLFFAGIGVVAPPAVRYLTYLGVEKVGASRSDPVRSLTPFFAILFAILFLGESFGWPLVLGTVLIVFGVLMISREGTGESKNGWNRSDLIFPLAAAALAGGIANLRKFGTELLVSPALAAAVAASSALIVFGAFLLVTGKWRELKIDRPSAKFLVISGFLTAVTDVLDLMVLKSGKVSVVVPLLAAGPILIIVLAHFFLRGIEKITRQLVFGALLVMGGVEVILLAAE
jgi:uncharacterized membrane protein